MNDFIAVRVRRRYLSSLLLTVFVVAGCAAKGAPFAGFTAPKNGGAELIIYRPDLFRSGGRAIAVYVDDAEVGQLLNGGWLAVPLEPGKRSLRMSERLAIFPREVSLTVTVHPGESLAVRLTPGEISGIFAAAGGPVVVTGPWRAQQIPIDLAEQELVSLKRSD